MNPNPFASLNHFTVPVTIYPLLSMFRAAPCRPARMTSGAANVTPAVPNLIQNRLPPVREAAVRPPISADSGNKTAVRERRSYHRRRISWCQRMAFDLSERASGVLLHPTSLPGPHGAGDLGPEARAFARWLREAGQRWWQMLPVGPIGYGNSPYSAQSAFAGNPLLVNLGRLAEDGLLSPRELADVPPFPKNRVDYAAVRAFRERHLRTAFAAFDESRRNRTAFEAFSARNAAWLDDFALYMAIKRSGGGKPWTQWEPGLRLRDRATLDRARGALRAEIQEQRFEQFLFDV